MLNEYWYRDESFYNNIYSYQDGYLNGNLWNNLYQPYKNFKRIDFVPRTEQGKQLLELSAVSFAAHELNLYLDLHPEDQSMFLLFLDYQKKANRLMEEYEEKYGPLCTNSNQMNQSFDWVHKNWPWEGQNV